MSSYNPTHRQLVERAGHWLSISKGCNVVLLERSSSICGEEPDVIGWNRCISRLVEVKVSRSDFLADKKKLHRRNPESAMGAFKYYLCQKELIQPDEIPEGWGLLWATEHQIREKKSPEYNIQSNEVLRYEMGMILKAIRHIRVGCILIPDNNENNTKVIT